MITSATKRQKVTPRRARQTFSRLQSLQDEIQTLKRQVAQMEQLLSLGVYNAASDETKPLAYSVPQFSVPQPLPELKPRRQPPPGMTAMQAIQGQWPGEETTQELLAQLKRLD